MARGDTLVSRSHLLAQLPSHRVQLSSLIQAFPFSVGGVLTQSYMDMIKLSG